MAQQMNILFLMADQLAPHFLPAYGHKVVKTPCLDEIAADSVIFDAHYTNSPLCVPARAGLLTGHLPSEVNVFDRGCDYEYSVPTFAHYLRANGYVTVQSGKAHYIGADPASWAREASDDGHLSCRQLLVRDLGRSRSPTRLVPQSQERRDGGHCRTCQPAGPRR